MINLFNLANYLNSTLDKCRPIFADLKLTDIWEKQIAHGRREIVTNIDIQIEEFLKDKLSIAYPKAEFISEETSTDPRAIENALCFVIDPIDGTKELVTGNSGFAISVAVLEYGEIVLGILDFPARNQRFQAIRGHGVMMNGQPLCIKKISDASSMRIAVSPSQSRDPRFELIRKRLGNAILIPIGALTPKIAAIILGEVDGAFYLPWDNNIAAIWDFAAAGLILKEAGGNFTDLHGKDLLNTLPIIHNGGWFASNSNCLQPLISKFINNNDAMVFRNLFGTQKRTSIIYPLERRPN